MPHAPPDFAEQFLALAADDRFHAALSEDCPFENPDLDFFCAVAELIDRGGSRGISRNVEVRVAS